MSDTSTIVCVEGIADNNIFIAASVLDNLQNRGIVVKELSDCTLKGLGYNKDDNYSLAVVGGDNDINLNTTGVKFLLEPTVYYTGEINPEFKIKCPHCSEEQFKDISIEAFYTEQLTKEQVWAYDKIAMALGSYNGTPKNISCNHCNQDADITTFDYSGSLTFSNLALEFYNWEEFNSDFIDELRELLGGKIKIYHMLY